MAQDPHAESRHARILRGEGPVFGPALDALVRDVEGRIPPGLRDAHRRMLEEWPIGPEGQVRDEQALLARLAALRAAPAPLPAGIPPGSPLKAVLGAALGGVLGVPFGFLVYVIMLATVLPYSLHDSDAVMWLVVLAVTGGTAALGAGQGMRPSRLSQSLAVALLAFVPAAFVSAILGAIIASTLGSIYKVSQMEGAFAMGVVFTIMPLAGFLGGAACAAWAGLRTWRRWGATSSPAGWSASRPGR